MDFDLEALDNEDPADFAEAGADRADGVAVDDLAPPAPRETTTILSEQTAAIEASGLLSREEVRAVHGILKRTQYLKETSNIMRQWCASRFTTDRWLDENEREWFALDRMCRSRPWAKNKDTPFPYPFRKATIEMRKEEGKWVGDDRPQVKDTRGKMPYKVITQVLTTEMFPPAHRVVLFAPEFGTDQSFGMDSWKNIKPEGEVDIWVVCWQGWHDFATMVQEVTVRVASFADGVDTVWYGQGMGAIVAYEVLKTMEDTAMQCPNLPVALLVSDCPAPHLFADSYKPYETADWSKRLSKYGAEVQGRIMGCVGMMRTYRYSRARSQAVLHIPIRAFCRKGERLAPMTSVREWDRYAKGEDFKLVDLGAAKDHKGYLEGQGYGVEAEPTVLETLAGTIEEYNRWLVDGALPDIGPVDGPLPTEVDSVVVGAGISGVYQAMELAKTGRSILVLDRYHKIGGVWQYYGNDYSRVNTSEIGYRIVEKSGPWARPNEDHTPRRDILRDIYWIASQHCHGRIRTSTEVTKVDKMPNGTYVVSARSVKDGTEHQVKAGCVCFHVNRRIGKRRDVDWENSDTFAGAICYGYGNEVKGLDFWGKTVLIVGAGAFAFENVRTALERGAAHVTLLGRRDGTTCPKWIDMIAFLRPLDSSLMTNRSANMISFDCWQKCYLDAGLRTPKCWDDGLLKPNNHTISVSDLAFIAGFHGMFKLQVGEIKRIAPDGAGVQLGDCSRIDCQIIIKCCGFHLNSDVPKVTGYTKMQPYGLLDFNLSYNAEPLLDGAQFGASKDQNAIEVEDRGFEWQDYFKGLEVLQGLGFNAGLLQPLGNPFGSGQGGPIDFQSKYFAYLVNHPKEQAALLAKGGRAEQEVVALWASQIRQYNQLTLGRLIASLAKIERA